MYDSKIRYYEKQRGSDYKGDKYIYKFNGKINQITKKEK